MQHGFTPSIFFFTECHGVAAEQPVVNWGRPDNGILVASAYFFCISENIMDNWEICVSFPTRITTINLVSTDGTDKLHVTWNEKHHQKLHFPRRTHQRPDWMDDNLNNEMHWVILCKSRDRNLTIYECQTIVPCLMSRLDAMLRVVPVWHAVFGVWWTLRCRSPSRWATS